MPYAQISLAQFAAAVADRTPGPAGGSALAVTAALGAALAELSARLSDDEAAADEATRLRTRLFELADEDANAYAEFMRTKTEEARARTIAVPQEIAEHAGAVAHLAQRLEREGNPRLEGDATAARLIAEAVQKGATRLIELNRAAAERQTST
jgi:formiminotetrahydrofolate cyclodeaminase